MNEGSRVYVAGHTGLVGSAIERRLREEEGRLEILSRARAELDLTDRAAVRRFFRAERPEYVFLAAARVGGIRANDSLPADFIRENLEIQTNVIDAAYGSGCRKLLFLGSSCIYPREAPQPMRESYLLGGPLEPTNHAYAMAKLAGLAMCQAYRRQHGFDAIALMPTNLYGPGDNFDLESSHVLPALIRKFHDAKASGAPTVEVWGTGTPRREFLFSDDLADAAVFLMGRYSSAEPVNVGVGEDLAIRDLAALVSRIVGYPGRTVFDASRPDGAPRKLLDVSRLDALGWRARTPLEQGIRRTYAWFLEHCSSGASGCSGRAAEADRRPRSRAL